VRAILLELDMPLSASAFSGTSATAMVESPKYN
jgi:hypothetical protein